MTLTKQLRYFESKYNGKITDLHTNHEQKRSFFSLFLLNGMIEQLNGIISKWNSDVIPKKSKGEVVAKFLAKRGLKDNKRFYNILTRQVQPTPDELEILEELINKYHQHHTNLLPICSN